ncbi:hypothetical protein DPMN_165516 [Dreissena polymorpha]|uniref:Uncharacterized protein n=1 Tax=Dreissena polymorpha TaxID=45954 RepID=A0A9D4EW87_DREPO|nr:hypothetical protein DPMN_165516 [Dreissena polymorpha]
MLLHCIICFTVRIPRQRLVDTATQLGVQSNGKESQLIEVSGQNSKSQGLPERMLLNISITAGELGLKTVFQCMEKVVFVV